MEISVVGAAQEALFIILDPNRLMMLWLGVIAGLAVGIIPGIGGSVGIALMLPFTFAMDSYTAFAFLLGLAAVNSTSDTIPAVMFGVPGTAAAQATILDGHQMAKNGEAGRALSAAYTASLLGGLAGAALMAISIPVIRPFILTIGAPELLAFALFGISMVALLSGSAPLRGLVAGCLGIMLSLIGTNPQTGTLRWTFGTVYLWDGLPLVPVILGLFALPELCDLAIRRTSTATTALHNVRAGMARGVRDALANWWLVVRCSWIGAVLGAIPGVTGSVISWIAYGHALGTVKGGRETFTKGDVRGVIAPESANNSAEGGQLVPAVAFGVPASTSMALLIGAFMAHGLTLGPQMLNENLHVTYTMVWSLAIANVVGAGLCFAFSAQFARLAMLRYSIIVPVVLCIIFLGAFQGTRHWGDLYTLLAFGMLGWVMKQLQWPRPPLILGLILGTMIERYGFIAFMRYGSDWIYRPIVIVLIAVALYTFLHPVIKAVWQNGAGGFLAQIHRPRFKPSSLFTLAVMGILACLLWDAMRWDATSRTVPVPLAVIALCCAGMSLISDVFFQPAGTPAVSVPQQRGKPIHMDLSSDYAGLVRKEVLLRAGVFLAWLLGFLVSMSAIGLLPTVPLFIAAYMRLENREPWRLVLPLVIVVVVFIYYVFGQMLGIPWPPTLLGSMFPALRIIPSV